MELVYHDAHTSCWGFMKGVELRSGLTSVYNTLTSGKSVTSA